MKNIKKFEGGLIGGAIGDALGYPIEFIRTLEGRRNKKGIYGIN